MPAGRVAAGHQHARPEQRAPPPSPPAKMFEVSGVGVVQAVRTANALTTCITWPGRCDTPAPSQGDPKLIAWQGAVGQGGGRHKRKKGATM